MFLIDIYLAAGEASFSRKYPLSLPVSKIHRLEGKSNQLHLLDLCEGGNTMALSSAAKNGFFGHDYTSLP
jgi:hypothetical protein